MMDGCFFREEHRRKWIAEDRRIVKILVTGKDNFR
jgi:hypothetical protein